MTIDYAMPAVLSELLKLQFDYNGGDGYDFDPYAEFLSASDTRSWFRAWTGNASVEGSEYRVFGQDGTGGYAAFWLKYPERTLLDQPIVFLGSEGEVGVVASDFADFLWLLADGFGPLEAIEYPVSQRSPNATFTAFAEKHAAKAKKTADVVLARASRDYPNLKADIDALSE